MNKSCINKDELSAMERQAMALVEKGDIDGAIHIYEASGIVEQFSNQGGFTLRCLQRLSRPDLATLPWPW